MKHTAALIKQLTVAISVLALLGAAFSAHAQEQRYISDTLRVPLRSGMGNQYRIVNSGLKSGTPLTLLATDTDENNEQWARVRTQNGTEGWLRAQYLLDEPTAAIKLEKLQSKMSQLGGHQQQMLKTNETLTKHNKDLQKQLTQLQQKQQKTQQDYASLKKLSGNTIALNSQYKKLNESFQLLQTRAEVLQTENDRLKSNQRFHEWLFGAGILFAGVILSFILQLLGRRRRRSEWG